VPVAGKIESERFAHFAFCVFYLPTHNAGDAAQAQRLKTQPACKTVGQPLRLPRQAARLPYNSEVLGFCLLR
jgi:hypothetical protein